MHEFYTKQIVIARSTVKPCWKENSRDNVMNRCPEENISRMGVFLWFLI